MCAPRSPFGAALLPPTAARRAPTPRPGGFLRLTVSVAADFAEKESCLQDSWLSSILQSPRCLDSRAQAAPPPRSPGRPCRVPAGQRRCGGRSADLSALPALPLRAKPCPGPCRASHCPSLRGQNPVSTCPPQPPTGSGSRETLALTLCSDSPEGPLPRSSLACGPLGQPPGGRQAQ